MTSPDTSATTRLASIRANIVAVARQHQRPIEAVELIAVSKTFPSAAIVEVLDTGQRVFGENRVQEAADKWPALKQDYPDACVHLIGPLQSNKAREAVALFDVIHSVDRPKIVKVLAEEMTRADRHLPVFIQVNTGAEPQKAGIAPEDLADFLALCRETHGLNVIGLMCIPPVDEEPAVHFAFLATLAERNSLENLSMGMSGDYATAIQFGATHVRVGSAIFGRRD